MYLGGVTPTTSFCMEDLIQLKACDIANYRKKLLIKQGNVCAICKLSCKKYVLDHQHKRRKMDPNGVNGNGLVRGTLCDGCNRIEGKVWNNAIRFGKHDMLPQLLRNMADYLEQDNYPWIHPSEKPCHPKIYKRKYNELKKIMLEKEQSEPPAMPKKKRKMSVRLLSYFKKYNIDPYTNSPSSHDKATNKQKKSSHTDLCENYTSNDLSSVSTQSCTGVEPVVESTD